MEYGIAYKDINGTDFYGFEKPEDEPELVSWEYVNNHKIS